ncbi:hypothetical protein ElyMa_002384200 [Elysia marginata]|uniref:Uncharacterized protein n=1 Tax=Elysia marginata TaxID=1093978 RepID=A0AAV4GD47_9GAST|nr:hypothetical protein ElyMa_002384200 [Elysia marginata]
MKASTAIAQNVMLNNGMARRQPCSIPYIPEKGRGRFKVIQNLAYHAIVKLSNHCVLCICCLYFQNLKSFNALGYIKELKCPGSNIQDFNNILSKTFDEHAPLTKRTIPQRRYSLWFDDNIQAAKQ